MQAKVGNPEVEKRVERILGKAKEKGIVVTVDLVAKVLKISWVTSRAILNEMVITGKAKRNKTWGGLHSFVLVEE